MKRIVFSMLAMIATVGLSAQTVQFPLSFVNVLPTGSSAFAFTVGAHPAATVGVDSVLKEQEIPSLPPPAGVFIVYSVPPTNDFIWLSPRDIRPLIVGERHMVTYELGITWNGGRLDISWGALPKYVDSAYITDVITDFPDNFIKQKIVPGQSYSTTNSAITKLKVLVWYDATNYASINEDLADARILAYPNPTVDQVRLKGALQGSHVWITDLTGRTRISTLINGPDQSIDLSDVEPGIYGLHVSEPHGAMRTTMIVRR
ncbi:MAG: T9SS type A sorting domain-containing protein [Candidatus Kapabacteria bacterium]|nr:T9SS type A sorting domain-containing protein [Candidatus Kapabacteria bacterium]